MKINSILANINTYRNINSKEVNSLIDNVTKSRYKGVKYAAIGNLASEILKIPPPRSESNVNSSFQYTISKDEAIRIALDFFKSIDIDFYKRAQSIINGEDKNISFNFLGTVGNNDNSYETRKNNEANVEHIDGFKKIKIHFLGNINDVYNIVHEISHIFDFPEKINLSRAILADVNSECFERMLDCYFEKKENVDDLLKQDLDLVRINSLEKTYYLALEYIVKYSFLDYKYFNGRMNLKDIKQVLARFSFSPNLVLLYLRNNCQDINYPLRYILGGLASEEYLQQYLQNPSESINRLKTYMELIKKNKGREALKELGINMNVKAYKEEIEKINNKINNAKPKEHNDL